MNGYHVTGATLGALIGYIAAHFGWNVSQDEGLAFGAAFSAVGGVIAHLLTGPGVIPAMRRGMYGPPALPNVANDQLLAQIKAGIDSLRA